MDKNTGAEVICVKDNYLYMVGENVILEGGGIPRRGGMSGFPAYRNVV